MVASDEIYWRRTSAGTKPAASAQDNNVALALGASGSLLELDLTNTAVTQVPLKLVVVAAGAVPALYTPFKIYALDLQVASAVVTPSLHTKIALTFPAVSIAQGDLLYWQSADQQCLAVAPAPPGTFHIAFTSAGAAHVEFAFDGVRPPQHCAPFRLCVFHSGQVLDYAVQVNVFGTPAAPTAIPTRGALPPTHVPTPTFSAAPTVRPPPTPAMVQPLPVVQVWSLQASSVQQTLTWSFEGALAFPDRLELLQGPAGQCGDGVSVPVASFLAS